MDRIPRLARALIGHVLLVLVLGAGVAVGACTPGTESGESESPQPEAEPVPSLSAGHFTQARMAGIAGRRLRPPPYMGRVVEVTGEFRSVENFLWLTVVTISDGEDFSLSGVQCVLREKDDEQLAYLKQGQRMTIRGRVAGYRFFTHVEVNECTIARVFPSEYRRLRPDGKQASG